MNANLDSKTSTNTVAELSEAIVLSKSRANSLPEVRSLQCWGLGVEKVGVVSKLTNVEVLNLSCNQISSLDNFSNCQQLRQLFLRKNNITSLEEIHHLDQLPNLEDVWLVGNPITSIPSYRARIIRMLPQIKQLDGVLITSGERAVADVGSAQHHAKLCAGVMAILPLLDTASLTAVRHAVDSLLAHHQH